MTVTVPVTRQGSLLMGKWRLDVKHPNGETTEAVIERVWPHDRYRTKFSVEAFWPSLNTTVFLLVGGCPCCGKAVVLRMSLGDSKADLSGTITPRSRRAIGELIRLIVIEHNLTEKPKGYVNGHDHGA